MEHAMMRHQKPPEVQLLRGGVALFASMMEAMQHAQHEVLLETYIFDFAGAGVDVAHALMATAQRGVRVQLVVDGVGTGALPGEWADRLAQAGVQCRVYSPLGGIGFWLPSRWRRLHRKLCVVDGAVAFCGGINILDDFIDPKVPGGLSHPRLDYAVRVTGPLVTQVHDTMMQLWSRMAVVTLHARGPLALVLRDNVRHRTQIERVYRKALAEARHEVVIASAYFFPSLRLRRALVMAARRGVRVCLLLPGRYEYFVAYRASRQLYRQLLAAGVDIYEYHASALHAKVAVVDRQWATVGSSNLDPFSLLLAREANVVVRDTAFAQSLCVDLMQAIAEGATQVDPAAFVNRPRWQRGIDWCASAILRFGVFLTGKRY
jgi:cardiolipin synthase